MSDSETKESLVETSQSPYDQTRHNAVKHGVLSTSEVLPWEDPLELQTLKNDFARAYQPQEAAEAYLVEELARLAFRKKRLYKAENALINEHLNSVGSYSSTYKDAHLLSKTIDLEKAKAEGFKEILYADQSEDQANIAYYQKYIDICQAVFDFDDTAYEQMLEKLPSDLKDHWLEWLEKKWLDKNGGLYKPTPKGLKLFLQEQVLDKFMPKKAILEAKPQIREQAIGMAYVPTPKMEILQRYETAVDRAFEKKLAMLLKLQDIRISQTPIISG